MWMRKSALAIQNGKNGHQRQQSFEDVPASGCQLIVKSQGSRPSFSPAIAVSIQR
jgi:hypothetical protein